ncbi:prenyltransferase/squalene oxidase repeat-containing protein [Saccharopolyspora phatthalungensis]|uniref:Prenyltransferase beta subunit n=1 Tax=Saccharopolyspora phatthalungensis TaxID=664693 RepID=A0A840QIN5_9PSEU|nr:prenyltransferase/squalene oxidase repeat-containing protein [Saccharopolyspora phatthalungensis]MBB5160020.1 prenyltransferase beta subunit [Saccharopolyspora phatthalungensis]
MLKRIFDQQGMTIDGVVSEALAYFQRGQFADGSIPDPSITEFPTATLLKYWDTINALKAIALWRDQVDYDDRGTVDAVLKYLRSCEKPNGLISWGTLETAPSEYCTETTSEYISSLTHLGLVDEAKKKAMVLRSQQLPSGPWSEVHPHVPKAFQTVPSVTGFALGALLGLDIEPLYVDEALNFLVSTQHDDGHFGINWFYYNTYYYLTRPVTAALANFGHYTAVAATRDFVLSQQREDGSWYTQVQGFSDFSSPELHTTLALETLVHAGMDADERAVSKGIAWLLTRLRPDGSWYGGPYPYPETDSYRDFRALQDVYATSQVLGLLKLLVDLENEQ